MAKAEERRERERQKRLGCSAESLTLLAAAALAQAAIVALLGPSAPHLLQLQLATDPDDARRFLATWSPNDHVRFKRHFLVDAWYPCLYAAFLCQRLLDVLAPTRVRATLSAICVLGASLDIFENTLHAGAAFGVFCPSLADAPDALLRAAAMAATAKWALLLPICVFILPGVATLLPLPAGPLKKAS